MLFPTNSDLEQIRGKFEQTGANGSKREQTGANGSTRVNTLKHFDRGEEQTRSKRGANRMVFSAEFTRMR